MRQVIHLRNCALDSAFLYLLFQKLRDALFQHSNPSKLVAFVVVLLIVVKLVAFVVVIVAVAVFVVVAPFAVVVVFVVLVVFVVMVVFAVVVVALVVVAAALVVVVVVALLPHYHISLTICSSSVPMHCQLVF